MPLREQKPKRFAAVMRGLAAGIVVFVLLVFVDQLSARLGLTGVARLGDNLLGATIVGVLTFLDERRRQRRLADRLQVIALMNHHVRNSLQTIAFAPQSEKEVELIHDAVGRIEWALREVLPGNSTLDESTLRAPRGRRWSDKV